MPQLQGKKILLCISLSSFLLSAQVAPGLTTLSPQGFYGSRRPVCGHSTFLLGKGLLELLLKDGLASLSLDHIRFGEAVSVSPAQQLNENELCRGQATSPPSLPFAFSTHQGSPCLLLVPWLHRLTLSIKNTSTSLSGQHMRTVLWRKQKKANCHQASVKDFEISSNRMFQSGASPGRYKAQLVITRQRG